MVVALASFGGGGEDERKRGTVATFGGGGCPCLPMVVVCGVKEREGVALASCGRGRLPWRLFLRVHSPATTAEREIVRLIKRHTLSPQHTHHQTYKEHGDAVSCTSKHTQHGDTIPFMTKQQCTTTSKHNTRKHRFLDVGSPQSLSHVVVCIVDPPLGNGRRVSWCCDSAPSLNGEHFAQSVGIFFHRTARSCHLLDYM